MQKINIRHHEGGHIIDIPADFHITIEAQERSVLISISDTLKNPFFLEMSSENNFFPGATLISKNHPKKTKAKMSSQERVCAHQGCYIKFKPASNASKYCPLHASKKKKLSPDEEAELNATLDEIRLKENNYSPSKI